jgi:hypothetical protein
VLNKYIYVSNKIQTMRRLHMKEAVGTKRMKGILSGEKYIFGSLGVPLSEDFTVCALFFRPKISSPNKSLKNITIIVITMKYSRVK